MYLFKWRKQANQSVAIFTELNIGLLLIWWHFAKKLIQGCRDRDVEMKRERETWSIILWDPITLLSRSPLSNQCC